MDRTAFENFRREFLTDTKKVKIAHNLSFESMFSYKDGIVIQGPVYDTIAASQMTLKTATEFRKLSDSGLKKLSAATLLHDPMPSFEDVTDGRPFDELDPAEPETIRYSCEDSDKALRLYHLFNGWFNKYLPRHRWIVENIESPTCRLPWNYEIQRRPGGHGTYA
jgi:DNA polymerase-1